MSSSQDAIAITTPVVGRYRTIPIKVAVIVALAAIGDWLFYRHGIGISAAVFLVALGLAAVATNPFRAEPRETIAPSIIAATGLIPAVVQPSLLAMTFGLTAIAYLVIATTERGSLSSRRLLDTGNLIVDITWRAPSDVIHALQNRRFSASLRWSSLIGWIIPLGLGATFLMLFSSANPLIDEFLSAIDLSHFIAHLNFWRTMLWLLIAALVWPFIYFRRRTKPDAADEAATQPIASTPFIEFPAALLNRAVILRSLVLFNGLFAVQTGLDLTYLWGGVALPVGMNYAAYAHRGAYPLIVTALLAAAFVIVALKPGSDEERSPSIRLPVFAWIAQNVLLVLSSILRLDLYVEVYSLSYWRLAAGIWMGLVATGLILIVVRISLRRSNRWLIGTNLAALAIVLYAVSLTNLPAFIADYNVSHSREISGVGQPLDLSYLASLGPQAVPALDRYIAGTTTRDAISPSELRTGLVLRHSYRMAGWRAWGYYDARLSAYLTR